MNFLDSFDVVNFDSATPARLGVALLCLAFPQTDFQTVLPREDRFKFV